MACSQCGRAVAEHDRFCGGCGASLAETCRGCGGPLDPAVAFCTSCGNPRTTPAPAGVASEDRRRVSVLFVDQVGFTPYAERTDPEQVRQLQQRFYAAVRRLVGQYGGVVEKYIGDAVMALFGAPVATETDALRCVRAGLELHRVLEGLGPDRLRFRVGVATGEALVDTSAAHHGGQAIVAGDVVNTAARLQAVAPEGGVLVCGRTHAMTASGIRYAAMSPVTLRGRTAATEVWLAVAPALVPRADTEPDPTPLVEREHELGLLTQALERVVKDRTLQLVTIFGQAGIGKSRLVRELRRRADQVLHQPSVSGPLVWHTGHCPPFGENVTYAGLADIVKAEAGILDTDETATARERLQAAVRRVAGPEADRFAEALQPLVGLPGSRLATKAEEAESAWRQFLVALAHHGPTVLVFEDLHWADEAMLSFIDLLATAARDAPLLVLCTARPELLDRDSSWAGIIAGSVTITLSPLRASSMATLCHFLLGQAAVTAETLRPLIELTNGNPLYALEYARMLVEQGSALPRLGDGDGQAAPMPESVHAVIANRLDLLDPADRAVLQAAAVVGMQFWPGAVAQALGRPVAVVERSLRRLEQRDFVTEQLGSTMAGQGEYRFGHVLVRDVCYQRLPRSERMARHALTANWLESLPHHRDSDLAEVLAHHRFTACEIARTVGVPVAGYALAARQALYLAARRAYALYAMDTAAGHATRALALLPDSGPAGVAADPALELERLRLELLASEIAFYREATDFLGGGGTDRLLALARRLSSLAGEPAGFAGPDLPAPPGVISAAASEAARAWTLLGQVFVIKADYSDALEHLRRAIALFDPLPDSPEKVDAYGELGRLHMLNYDCGPAIAAAGTAAAVADRLGLVEARAQAQITIATARYECGDEGGLAELRRVTADCRANRLLALPRAIRNLAHVIREEGDWPTSEKLLTEAELAVPAGRNVYTDYSGTIMRANFMGELDVIAKVAESPRSQWEEYRGLVACVRLLRGDPPANDDTGVTLADVRANGFRRTVWYNVAIVALCRALQRRIAEAADLLGELTTEWQKVSVIPSGGWISAASFAAALTGPEPAEALRVPLAALPRHTPWSEAALHTVTAAVALAAGQGLEAAGHHLAASGRYAQIPTVTDQMISLALAAAAYGRADEPDLAQPVLAELRQYAERRGAYGLLRIAEEPLGAT